MNITFLAPNYCWRPSGGIRVIYEHANQLVARSHQVSVVHPRRLKYLPPQYESLTLYQKTRRLAEHAKEMFFKPSIAWHPVDPRVKSLYVHSSDEKYIPDADAIFATSWQTVESVLRCTRSKGKKFYLIQGYENFMGPKETVDATWRAPLYKVAVSKWLLEIGKQLGCKDIGYVPNAIDMGQYPLLDPIEKRKPRVTMIFSKAPNKGAAEAIAALEIVRAKHPDLKVVAFGLTRIRPSIPEWIAYHSNPSQDFIVRQIYNQASIFLSSSWSEGFALPPAEAAACGCAIVATDSGGIREYVVHRVTGLLSEPKDPVALAANVSVLLEDDALRVQLNHACRERLAAITWKDSAARLEEYILRPSGQKDSTTLSQTKVKVSEITDQCDPSPCVLIK